MFRPAKTEVNLNKHVVSLMTDIPFFAEISRHIKKVPTNDIPTAAVAFNPKTEDIVMGWNPEFIDGLGNWQIRGTLIHELYHVIFGHLNVRRMQPPILWNIATDCAINSLIMDAAKRKDASNFVTSKDDTPLPPGCVIPGQWPTKPDGRELSKEEKEASTLGHILSKLPLLKSSEFYYHKILEQAKKYQEEQKQGGKAKKGQGKDQCQSPGQGGQGKGQPGQSQPGEGEGQGGGAPSLEDILGEGNGRGSIDDHSFWDSVPEEQRPFVEGKVKDIVEKAVRRADSRADGWGNMPAELIEEIRKSVSRIINWRQVLRQFSGSLIKGRRRTSIKRINKRYPYVHPGTTKGYMARLLIAIDQSGSVDDGMLEMFFAELRTLNKKIEIDILPFDCSANVEEVYTWKRGACPMAKRTRTGGTDFNAPTRVANDPKNRGRWDGLLIMTDGMAPEPIGSRIKRGWVIGQGQTMHFSTSELVIKLDDGQPSTGAWR